MPSRQERAVEDPATQRSPGPPAQPDSGEATQPGGKDDTVLSVATVEISSDDVAPVRRFRERGLLIDMVKEEVVRAAVALLLIALLTFVIYMAFRRAKTWDETKQLLDLVLPAVTALLGSAVGFYFGTKAGS
jgi:hypothetical protein